MRARLEIGAKFLTLALVIGRNWPSDAPTSSTSIIALS